MRIFKQQCTLVISFFVFGLIVVYGDTISKTIQVTYRNISILVKGKPIQSEQEPFIYEGRIFAPLRTIAEAVNKNIEWDNEKNQVNITDKQSGNINLPFHKIGERVEVYPYVITLKKVYIEPFKHPEDKTIIGLINIELSLDFIEKKHGVYINQCCSFVKEH